MAELKGMEDVLVVPQLRRNPQVFPLQTRLQQAVCDALAYFLFIAVCGGAIDVAVAALDCPGYRFGDIVP